MSRSSALGPVETFLLRQWGGTLREAFGVMPYHVGSSVGDSRDYRDVDVRIMLDDDDPLLAVPERHLALNVALTVWGQRVTGLPIDCQLQAVSVGNDPKNNGPRRPIGMDVPADHYLDRPTEGDAHG